MWPKTKRKLLCKGKGWAFPTHLIEIFRKRRGWFICIKINYPNSKDVLIRIYVVVDLDSEGTQLSASAFFSRGELCPLWGADMGRRNPGLPVF